MLSLPLLGLSGCMMPPPAATGSKLPTYSTDLAGKAAECTVSPVTLADGKETAATMTTGGSGWCGIALRRNDQPLGAGLLIQPAKSGTVYVHTVGDDTRVDYTPRYGTSGADSFAVRFIPGDAILRVSLTNTAPPPPPPAALPPKPAPTHRTSRARTAK